MGVFERFFPNKGTEETTPEKKLPSPTLPPNPEWDEFFVNRIRENMRNDITASTKRKLPPPKPKRPWRKSPHFKNRNRNKGSED